MAPGQAPLGRARDQGSWPSPRAPPRPVHTRTSAWDPTRPAACTIPTSSPQQCGRCWIRVQLEIVTTPPRARAATTIARSARRGRERRHADGQREAAHQADQRDERTDPCLIDSAGFGGHRSLISCRRAVDDGQGRDSRSTPHLNTISASTTRPRTPHGPRHARAVTAATTIARLVGGATSAPRSGRTPTGVSTAAPSASTSRPASTVRSTATGRRTRADARGHALRGPRSLLAPPGSRPVAPRRRPPRRTRRARSRGPSRRHGGNELGVAGSVVDIRGVGVAGPPRRPRRWPWPHRSYRSHPSPGRSGRPACSPRRYCEAPGRELVESMVGHCIQHHLDRRPLPGRVREPDVQRKSLVLLIFGNKAWSDDAIRSPTASAGTACP